MEQKKQPELENGYATFRDMFRALARKYGDVGMDGMYSAFSRTSFGSAWSANPYVQNQRVKRITSPPLPFGRDELVEMLRAPQNSEIPLRQATASIEWAAYPLRKLRKTYQDILCYYNYIYPRYLPEDVPKGDLLREWRLVEKFRRAMQPEVTAHKIVGQAVRSGKVFYYPRFQVDKSHNSVNYAFLQQLPEDRVKIVGFNNITGYTVAFDMMYFLEPGTDWRQFGDLFAPYMDDFDSVIEIRPRRPENRLIYATHHTLPDGRPYTLSMKKARLISNAEVYQQGGRWFYWVTLPADAVWTFQSDDVSAEVITPLSGLLLSFLDISHYANAQLEIVSNPLVSLVTGEIPYTDGADATSSDPYKLSPTGRAYFEHLFYEMMAENNTSGVGLFLAPAENLRLQQLSEAPNGSQIASNGYAFAMQQSGNGVIPVSTDPKAGAVNISAKVEAEYGKLIYRQYEQMMEYLISTMRLRYDWGFSMFGDVFSREDDMKTAKDGATLGIMSEMFRYNAMMGRSVLDDLSMSAAVEASGIMDLRKPLVTSYSAKNNDPALPPSADPLRKEAGRPEAEGVPQTDGQEKDEDF